MLTYVPRVGYACMNEDIHPNTYRTLRKDSITHDRLHELIEHNLKVLEDTIDYNISVKNTMFRVSSSLIPFGSSPLNTLDWAQDFADTFTRINEKIRQNNIRISVHPGQYTVINSPNPAVVKNSILELEYHAKILDLLAPVVSSTMVLHVGGIYEDKDTAVERFINTYNMLSENVRKYLAIENDDRLYTVADVLEIAKRIPVPVIFDNLHHDVNPSLDSIPLATTLQKVALTWEQRGCIPKMHYSQQAIGKRVGAHSDTINMKQFDMDYSNIYSHVNTDIMLEVKDKNRSFIRVNQYFNPSQKVIEKEWARYKYWVMARSQKSYNDLRELFRENHNIDATLFYMIVDELRDEEPQLKSLVNAFQHVWGYFKNIATDSEKTKYLNLIETLDLSKTNEMYKFLHRLTNKYDVRFLQDSYFFGL